eukprot:PLAT15590.1.p1 GENE.PLAT15590.1~~PLAT15590.1.p1  ORF type:complete len:484 (+),score=115.96 PLAT15590.1:69-1520(+)
MGTDDGGMSSLAAAMSSRHSSSSTTLARKRSSAWEPSEPISEHRCGDSHYAYSQEQVKELAAFEEPMCKSLACFAVLGVGMTLLVLLVFLTPAPAEPEHLTVQHIITWGMGYLFIVWILREVSLLVAGVRYKLSHLALFWVLFMAIAIGVVAIADSVFDVYPIPLSSALIGTPLSIGLLSVAYVVLPAEVRNDRERVKTLFYGWACIVFLFSAQWMLVLFRVLFVHVDGMTQAFLVLLLPLLRFGNLRLLEMITTRAAKDSSLCAIVSFPLKHYSSFFAVSLYGNASGIASALLVLQEVAGSVIYLCKMHLMWRRTMMQLPCSRKTVVVPIESATTLEEMKHWRQAAKYGTPLPHNIRATLRTSGFLAVEEVVENIVTIQWLALLCFFYYSYQKNSMFVISDISPADLQRTATFLAINALSELLMLCITSSIVERQFGINLFQHASWRIRQSLPFIVSTSGFLMMFTLSIFVKFNGYGLLLDM